MSPYFLPDGDGVLAALRGLCDTYSTHLALTTDPLYVRALDASPSRRVGLVSGGGSGHEPLHAGFVGRGMLDAAVPGQIFASPHNRQIYEASRAVARDGEVLHIVKNYTGDRINFGIAAERLKLDGIRVARVLVDDDVATESADTITGRRGTAATILVEKVLGAAADEGRTLDELVALGERASGCARSIAVARRAHTAPGTGELAFELPPGEIDFGIGIHGERAAATVQQEPLPELVGQMADRVLAGLPEAHSRVIAIINGLGGVANLELFAITAELTNALASRSVELDARAVGTFVPALDMAGFSITLAVVDDELAGLWRAPTGAPGWATIGA